MSAAHDHHQPKAAPGELDKLRMFVNTFDVEAQEDDLRDPAATARWFAERDLLPDAEHLLTDADVRQTREMREALRKLLLAHNGAGLDPDAIEAVNAAAKSAELVVRFDERGEAALVPVRPGIDGALGRMLAIAFRAMTDGTWRRLKACPAEDCEWAFYDWSKNGSGTWCDMAVCGNRAKARAYRERRQRGTGAGAHPA